MKTTFLAVCIIFCCIPSFAQQLKLDSLLKLNAEYTKEDFKKIRILNEISYIQINAKPVDGVVTADKAIYLSLKLNNQKELANSYNNKASNLISISKYSQADSILQKALAIHNSIKNDEGLADTYLRMSSTNQNDSKRALFLLHKSLDIYRRLNNKKGEGDVYLIIGGLYRNINCDTAIIFFQKSLSSYLETKDEAAIAIAIGYIGGTYIFTSSYDKAMEYINKSLAINERIKSLLGLETDYMHLSILYGFKSNHPFELEYMLKALRISEKRGNIENEASIAVNLGFMYIQLKDYPKAMVYLDKGLELSLKLADKSKILYTYMNIVTAYQGQNKNDSALACLEKGKQIINGLADEDAVSVYYSTAANFYQSINKQAIAFGYLNKAMELNKKLGNNVNYVENILLLIKTIKNSSTKQLAEMGIPQKLKYSKAINYAYQVLDLIKESGELDFQRDAYKELSELYAFEHDVNKSFEYYKRFIIFKDSIMNKDNVNSVANLQIQYETEKKEQQINLLSKDKAIQDKELDKQKVVRNGFIAGFGVMILFAGLFLFQRNKISKEKRRSDQLLLNILPSEVAEELKTKGSANAKQFDNVTVLFTDFISFTTVSEQLTPQELVDELHSCFMGFDEIMEKYGIEKIKTIGDAYLAVCGLPQPNEKHAENVVYAAIEIKEFMENRRQTLGEKTFGIRIGLNSGSVVAGIVGVKKFAYDIWGDTVNTAARMEQNSEAGKINISETTYELVKDKYKCEYRGEIDAKNKGKLKMYFVSK